jgi:eukaryotic-like serine/threonine-protein kinase
VTSSFVCLHRHQLQAPDGNADVSELCCPICGSVVREAQDSDSSTGDAFKVAQVPHSLRQSHVGGILSGLDPNSPNKAATDSDADKAKSSTENSDTSPIDDSRDPYAATTIYKANNLEQLDVETDARNEAASNKADGNAATEPVDQSAAKIPKLFEPPKLPDIDVMEELGRGGFGVVYRAYDEKHNREVALKTLQKMGPDDLVRFKREFRALADIAHPNLASLYELLADGNTWCFTMEILKGVGFLEYVWSEFDSQKIDNRKPNTAEVINPSSRLSLRRTNRLYEGIKQLVVGLNQLHRADKLHSDIKPSNVLVTTDGRVVLLDFGLIAEIHRDDDGRLPDVIQGTPHYMSPEQAACQRLTEASDWYSVGVMLYELLTGRLPFQDKAVKSMLRKQYERPVEPAKRQPGIPRELNDLCMALLEIEPSSRPDAAEILRAVDAPELADQLIADAAMTVVQADELVGREEHFEVLSNAFKEVQAGETRSVFVHGRSGMGKSALVRSFVDDVKTRGQSIVLEGRCYEQESVPFKALDCLIDALVVYLPTLENDVIAELLPEDTLPLIQLFPVFAQIGGTSDDARPTTKNADQKELRTRALATLRELLARLGRRQSLVLYIDDLQWGDEDSSNLLAELVRPPNAPQLLLLGSYRRENINDSPSLLALRKAYQRGQTQPHQLDLPVDPLSEADAERLALNLLGRDDRATRQFAARIAGESGGSPFFVWELAQHVQDGAETVSGSLDLDEVIWSRVCRLTEEARSLLEVFSVAGRPMRASEAYETIDARTDGPKLLALLRTSNFVRTSEAEQDTIVETYHDRIRESVVNHLPVARVRGHFLKLALAIEQSGDVNLAELISHVARTAPFAESTEKLKLEQRLWQRIFDMAFFFDAAEKPERARTYALVAAEQASTQNALEVAEQQFEIARKSAETADDATRFRIAEGLGDVLLRRGRYDRANQQFQLARAMATENLTLARIDGKRGYVCFKQGDMGNSAEHFERALTELGNAPPSNSVSRILALSKEALVQVLHTYFPKWLTGRRQVDTEKGQMDLFRARLYDGLGYPYWFTQGPIPTLWTHLRHMNLADRYPPTLELGRSCSMHAIMMTAVPLADRGVRFAEKSYGIHGDLGDRFGQGQARSFQTFSLIAEGRFREGVASGREAIRLLEEAGDVWEANMARIIVSFAMYFSGEFNSSYIEAKRAFEIGKETGDYSAMALALYFWVLSNPHTLPEGGLQIECEREREDPLSTSAAWQGRGLELLLREDKPAEAAVLLEKSLEVARKLGLRNPCIFCGVSWKATALRIVAEREQPGPAQQNALAQAKKAVRAALKITKKYRTSRSIALREAAMIAVLENKPQQARRYFAESLSVATQQEAAFEQAQTKLLYGTAGLKFDWPNAQELATEGQAKIEAIHSAFGE